MGPSSELRSDYSQGNLHDGVGDGEEAGDGVEDGVGEDGEYLKNICHTKKKILNYFQNNGSWNPVMRGCQIPDFCKLPEEQIWPFPRMVTATQIKQA